MDRKNNQAVVKVATPSDVKLAAGAIHKKLLFGQEVSVTPGNISDKCS